MNRDFVVVENEMYEVLRVVKESNNPVIEKWKEHTSAEKVFRKEGLYYFCRKITEPEFEMIPWNEEDK